MSQTGDPHTHAVHLPQPTAWPFLMALGITLACASLVTSAALGYLGGVLALVSAIGWFRQVLPHEAHEDIVVTEQPVAIEPSQGTVARIEVDETHRAQLPLETFPISAGIKGGIAGGIAMVIPAEIYGLIRYHSIWYVVNLLGGAGVGTWTNPTVEQMRHFHLVAFITANIIQGVTTLLVGVLYGAMLPIWPRRPILLGGIIAPVLWTGLLHSVLGIVNPFLAENIDWWSFAASQVFFGVVAGYTVTRLGHLKRLAQAPLSVRLGLETPGLHPTHEGDERKQ
ncbi:hypothetical protein DYQ86_27305 [Acidobacteria bacterium AB60]|nr:hypothetical protein DYQ86_27305 [Acidobacteria bacterium AB60]